MTGPLRVLILEDRAADAELMLRELRRAGFMPDWRRVQTERDFVAALDDALDLVLADYQLPQFDGLHALRLLRERGLDTPFILVTGTLGEEVAVDCIKQGAEDYVVKDRVARLGPAVTSALDKVRLRRAHRAAQQDAEAAHQQLIESEARYRALFENLRNGYLRGRVDRRNGTIDAVGLEVNPAFERLTGLPDPVGIRMLDLFPNVSDQNPEMVEALAAAAGGAPPRELEFFFKPLRMWTDATVYHSPPDEFILIFNNITERKHTEAALLASQARLAAAVSGANIGIWEWNPATNAVYLSPEWKKQLGYADDEIEGSLAAWESRLHPDDKDRALAAVQNYLADPSGGYSVEFRLRHKDGSYRWIRARAVMSINGGGERVMVGCHLDVTEDHRQAAEREQLEAQLRQAHKLEAIGQLTGGVAHDFNNLLTAILGFASLLEESLPSADPRYAELREIQNAGNRAAALTRQLLAFSRRQVLEPKVVDLNEIVSGLIRMLARLIGEHIALETILDPDLVATHVDPGQIEQVITNLVVNARDAMPDGGTLRLETATLSIDESTARAHPPAEPESRYVRLRVADTGVGMEDAVLTRIFEPFFTTKPLGKGTGLGLSTVYGIVQQSGGFIDVLSRPGEGCTFDVYLPALAVGPDAITGRATTRIDTGTETILLVEDEEAVRRFAHRVLERRGYRVLAADGPMSAVKTAEDFTGPIDLLLSDVLMPGGTGPDLYRVLAGQRPGLKVLFMSGYSSGAAALDIVPPGHLLQKPFEPNVLTRRVREAIDTAPAELHAPGVE